MLILMHHVNAHLHSIYFGISSTPELVQFRVGQVSYANDGKCEYGYWRHSGQGQRTHRGLHYLDAVGQHPATP